MVFCTSSLVPAMACLGCGHVVPVTRARPVRASRADEKALERAARRERMKRAL